MQFRLLARSYKQKRTFQAQEKYKMFIIFVVLPSFLVNFGLPLANVLILDYETRRELDS